MKLQAASLNIFGIKNGDRTLLCGYFKSKSNDLCFLLSKFNNHFETVNLSLHGLFDYLGQIVFFSFVGVFTLKNENNLID